MTRLNVLTDTPDCIVTSEAPCALLAINQPGCAAAIWRRDPLPCFQAWIDDLAPRDLPRSRILLRSERVCDALMTVCEACGTPESPERDRLIDDAAALAAIFADVVKARYLRIRLDVIDGNACPKFHVDRVTARLICTYRGTGTQYGIAGNGADPGRVLTVPTGSPIILRGTSWPETPMSGLLHRSPPIEGTGETRLVLVLDPVDDLEDELDRHVLH